MINLHQNKKELLLNNFDGRLNAFSHKSSLNKKIELNIVYNEITYLEGSREN